MDQLRNLILKHPLFELDTVDTAAVKLTDSVDAPYIEDQAISDDVPSFVYAYIEELELDFVEQYTDEVAKPGIAVLHISGMH